MDRKRIQGQITNAIICLLCIIFACLLFKKDKIIDYDKYLVFEKTIPHNSESFTEGLIINENIRYESSGKYEKSFLEKTNNKENTLEKTILLDQDIFAEGITIFKDKLYLLTYKENKLFIFNKDTLEQEQEISYPKEGWGITHNEDYIITSDGTNIISFWTEDLKLVKELTINRANINELEYIDGKIWANIWKTNQIIIINPKSGKIEKTLTFDAIAEDHKAHSREEVMNGIAYDEKTKKIYLTGKNWENIYVFHKKH